MAHPSHIKNQRRNHPQKGSCITVDPIRSLEDIQKIKNLLKNRPRDYLLFTIGINNGLRAGDLLQLKAESFKNVKIGDKVRIKEQKRGKLREIVVNKSVKEALDRYFAHYNGSHEYLFQSKKVQDSPITVQRANIMVKSWCSEAGLQGNFGSHTLRKTFGTILRTVHKVPWELISESYNHSSPKATMTYLGIQSEEINGVIMDHPI